MDPEPDNPTRVLGHNEEDPMGLEPKGLTPKAIDTPQTIFYLTNAGKPGGPTIELWAKVRRIHLTTSLSRGKQRYWIFVQQFWCTRSWDCTVSSSAPV